MNTAYWVKEYIFVFIAYGLVMFLWPEIVFRRWLRGRSLTLRICFDSMFMTAAINFFVLLLGLCHILNPWVVRICFWGILLASLAVPFVKKKGAYTAKRFLALLTGGYGIKSFSRNVALGTGDAVKVSRKRVNGRLVNHVILYALLTAAIIYGMIYYSIGVFQNPSFGFSDIYTHEKWIYYLTQGTIFSSGIYPEGMHTFVYLINTCFGIPVYSVLLYLQPVHIALFLLAIFLFGKEIFNWRYTGIIVLILFLTVGYGNWETVFVFSRLQCALPMEFGAVATLLCPTFLLRYLKETRQAGKTGDHKKIYQDENLIIFGLSLYGTISIHFYCTIVAFFLCLAIVPWYFKEVFSRKCFCRLLLSVLAFTVLSTAPMLLALAEGMEFQGSIGYAINVMAGTDTAPEAVITPGSDGTDQVTLVTPTPEQKTEAEALNPSTILEKTEAIYSTIFDEKATQAYLIAAVAAAVCLVLAAFIVLAVRQQRKKKGQEDDRKLVIAPLATLLLMLMNVMLLCNPGVWNLPRLIDEKRLNYYATLLNMMTMLIPLDLIFGSLNLALKDKGDGIVAMAVSVGSVVLVLLSGSYHGTLYFELTRYSSVVNTTVDIMRENEDYTYTIVATSAEIWQVKAKGRHEELVKFLNGAIGETDTGSYKLPTEKIYIYIEKHPLQYIQQHFPDVPTWLANNERDQALLEYTTLVTTGDEVVNYDLDEEQGEEKSRIIANNDKTVATYYTNKYKRIGVESRAMDWIEDFEKLYKWSVKTYYEDDDFVCYCIEQNTNAPYELAVQAADTYDEPSGDTGTDASEDPSDEDSDEIDYVIDYVYNEKTGEIVMRIKNGATGEIIDEYVVSQK